VRARPDPCSRALRVEGLVNARDLGGLRRHDGTATPSGVFFRSESVDALTPIGWEQVHAAGIRTVVDLRQPGERALDVGQRPGWVTTVHVDLDGRDNELFWKDYWDNGLVGTALYYLPHLTAMPERAAAALSAIVAAPPGGVLFHCAGGRDRTGLIALLLLCAVGTEAEVIVEDYLETVHLAGQRAAMSGGPDVEAGLEAICHRHGTTTEGALRAVVDSVDLPAVLDAAAMTRRDRDALATWRGSIPAR
jgi:hypothetical protein